MREYETKTGSPIAALLQGAAVGAVLGVLFAPKAGKRLREDFNAWLGDRRREAREGFEEGYQEMERHDKEPMGI